MLQLPGMAKMIQVRNVPARLHRELVRRARARGQTLTDYIQAILRAPGGGAHP
jgi:plasmid stability protein